MAKKKTENIKAAPVLRASGDDPSPVTPTITKSYSIRDDWKDSGIVNYVAFKSVDGEVQDLTVNGQPAGGGGGGLAEVTIINNTANEIEVGMIYVNTDMPPFMGDKFDQGVFVSGSSSLTVQAPTNGDYNKAQGMEGATITATTGDIELNATTHIAIIRGNGTITIS